MTHNRITCAKEANSCLAPGRAEAQLVQHCGNNTAAEGTNPAVLKYVLMMKAPAQCFRPVHPCMGCVVVSGIQPRECMLALLCARMLCACTQLSIWSAAGPAFCECLLLGGVKRMREQSQIRIRSDAVHTALTAVKMSILTRIPTYWCSSPSRWPVRGTWQLQGISIYVKCSPGCRQARVAPQTSKGAKNGQQRQQQCCFAVAGAGCTRLGEQKRGKVGHD